MSCEEFEEWAAVYRKEPWGDYRLDINFGIANSILANVNRDSKKRPEPYSPADFMPFVERKTTAEQFRAGFSHLIRKKK